MEAPNPNKRLRRDPPSSSGPSSLPSVPDLNQNHVDLIISSFLSLPDLPSLSSSLSISNSFDRAIEKQLQSFADESVQDGINDRGIKLASLFHESTKRCARKLAADRNSSSWALPYELTIKVFSMLDTKSLVRASACCTMFKKCAMDPLCYSHIELPGSAGNRIVRRMILNARKELRKLLRSLHLYDNRCLDKNFLLRALSICSNLTELKISFQQSLQRLSARDSDIARLRFPRGDRGGSYRL
ncbi:hypothetical protein Bca4012_019126 [Brassica carinata]